MTEHQIGFDAVAREQLLDQVLEHASDPWRDMALRGIAKLAATGRDFQATDLIAIGVYEPDHPNRWGGVFYAASKAGLIEHVGYAPSGRRTVQGSAVKVWRGKEIRAVDHLADRIRALSVNRPLAGLIMAGVKDVENRGRTTHYRGPLVIHASQRAYRFDEDDPLLEERGVREQLTAGANHPTGFLGVVDLVDVCTAGLEARRCFCGPWASPPTPTGVSPTPSCSAAQCPARAASACSHHLSP
jgi:hypothetical protein